MSTQSGSAASLILTLCLTLSSNILMAENRIDTQRPDAPELAAYGHYEVGTRPIELINPDQVDINGLEEAPDPIPLYDRPLTVQMWYPAFPGAEGRKSVRAFIRDGVTEVDLQGQATLWAAPVVDEGPFPLVIISHGYPGNRFLLSHLAENLASKGYVVASIDHTDSTYRTINAFGSTLRNRSLDQIFVLNEMDRLSAVITAGGGVSAESVDFFFSPPFGLLDIHRSGSDTHNALPDPRIKTAVGFAPWGHNSGFFTPETMAGVQIPMLLIAGSADDVSGYEIGTRAIWQGAVNVDRALLTYNDANHNAAAPYPAPAESYEFNANLGFAPFGHYADAVWDTVRMNNIAQHFVTAWLGQYLKADADSERYLDLIPNSNDGVYDVDENGEFTDEHTYWAGFEDRSAKALRFEWLHAGE